MLAHVLRFFNRQIGEILYNNRAFGYEETGDGRRSVRHVRNGNVGKYVRELRQDETRKKKQQNSSRFDVFRAVFRNTRDRDRRVIFRPRRRASGRFSRK